MVASEPANAASGSNSFCMKRRLSPNLLSVNTIAAAAKKAPPEDTPTSAGSASGLRNRPCMIAPDTASRAPTMAAAAIRGIRIDHNTSWSRDVTGLTGCSGHTPERRGEPGERNARGAHRQRDEGGGAEHGEAGKPG